MKYLGFIVAMITVLSISSCRLSRSIDRTKETTLDHRDSTYYSKQVIIDTISIPERSDSLQVTLDRLIQMGEINHYSNGVRTIIKHHHDTITATCICDSLQKLIASTIEREFQYQKRNKDVIQNEHTKDVVVKTNWTVVLILTGLLILAIIFIIIKSKLW